MDTLTLSQLNDLVGEAIRTALPATYWVIAETSDVRLAKNGHCYLEFIEKKDSTISAKARGYIWSRTFQMLQPYFEMKTGQAFVSGIKVLVQVSVNFHSAYGYGLNVLDIDPTYTAGDMQRRRQEILDRLEKEGVLSLNKELEMPLLPQRLAIVTSPTAAGYEDFLNQLTNNGSGFVFYPRLFPAVMQGEQTERSIIEALNAIYGRREDFDAVIIIRGGGATSDLASFDTYNLATNCAQFPLPIITGIGHERDDTVLDFVAHHRAKTPTAAAEYLLRRMEDAEGRLIACETDIVQLSLRMLDEGKDRLRQMQERISDYLQLFLERQNSALTMMGNRLEYACSRFLLKEENKLKGEDLFFKLSSPEYILSKGYSITTKEGRIVPSAQSLMKGDRIETILRDGRVSSVIS
jgi:exodeoxyribonuclease VII large subunit